MQLGFRLSKKLRKGWLGAWRAFIKVHFVIAQAVHEIKISEYVYMLAH